jgi:small-conductance mechanosensitive channel
MVTLNDPLALASAAAALLGIALYIRPLTLPVLRAVLRIAAFVGFTAALLHAGIAPTHPVPAWTSAVQHEVGQLLIGLWWLGGAAVVNSVVRATLRIRHRPARERLLQDIVATVAYILAAIQICDKVFGLPIGALLATSGVVAIVVGLALQSTLGDAFSGLLLNLTRPYRIGDWIVVDAALEGQVVETNWRATHLMTVARNIAVVPNSVLAKTTFTNTSASSAPRGITLHIQLRPDVRPRVAATALDRALKNDPDILESPAPQIAIRASKIDYVDYEVRFYISRQADDTRISVQVLDKVFEELDVLGVCRTPPGSGPLRTE